MSDNKIKRIVMVLLVLIVFVMGSAYATLYQNLRINGNASVIASWKVEITGIEEGQIEGNAHSGSIPTYNVSAATFDARLYGDSDSIEYVVTIKNGGEIDAKLDDIAMVQSEGDTIIYELLGVAVGDVLKAGDEVRATVRVKTKPDMMSGVQNVISDVTIIFDYVQNI